MRNLKKVLSLALALVMLLGMMVVGAGAATDFKDADKIENTEAVDVVSGIGVLQGDENKNFNPTGTLSRAEAAVVIAKLDLGAAFGNLETTNASTFSDVPAGYWGKAYIDYCAARGLIAGDGAGRFLPNEKVSGVQFALMVARVLGYEDKAEQIGGADWEVEAAALARKAGLTDGVTLGSQAMTRDEMAQVAYNALKANMVEYRNGTIDITVGGTPVTIGGNPATPKAATGAHYDKSAKQDGVLQLCEEKFPQLTVESSEDNFYRPSNVWTYKRTDIAEVPTAAMAEYTAGTKGTTINSALKPDSDATVEYYVDGKQDTDIKTVADLKAKTSIGTNGVLTQAWYDEVKNTVKVTLINTYVGRISGVTKATATADRYVTVSDFSSPANTLGSALNKKFETEDFAARDVVLYTAAWDGTEYDIQTVEALGEPDTGRLTKWSGNSYSSIGQSENNFTSNGTTYKYSANKVIVNDTGAQTGPSGIAAFKVNESDISVYTDKYGYAIYVAGVEGEKNYAAVIGVGTQNIYGSGADGCTLLLPDGTIKTVTYRMKSGSAELTTSNVVNNTNGSATNGYSADIVYYRELDNGTYELEVVNGTTAKHMAKYGDEVNTPVDTTKDLITFTNGKSAFVLKDYNSNSAVATTLYTTSNTIFMVATKDGSSGRIAYNVYTGYNNAPSIDTTKANMSVAYVTNSYYTSQIDVVYLAYESMAGITSVDAYIAKAKKAEIVTDSTGSYYELAAVVDGEVTTLKVDASITAPVDLKNNANTEGVWPISNVVKDKNDIITGFTVTDTNTNTIPDVFESICGVAGTVSANGVVLGVGASTSPAADETALIGAAKYWAYTDNTKVYAVSKDYKTIEAIDITSVDTDVNDKVFASVTDGAAGSEKKLKDVFVVTVDNTTATKPPINTGNTYVKLNRAATEVYWKNGTTKPSMSTALDLVEAALVKDGWTVNGINVSSDGSTYDFSVTKGKLTDVYKFKTDGSDILEAFVGTIDGHETWLSDSSNEVASNVTLVTDIVNGVTVSGTTVKVIDATGLTGATAGDFKAKDNAVTANGFSVTSGYYKVIGKDTKTGGAQDVNISSEAGTTGAVIGGAVADTTGKFLTSVTIDSATKGEYVAADKAWYVKADAVLSVTITNKDEGATATALGSVVITVPSGATATVGDTAVNGTNNKIQLENGDAAGSQTLTVTVKTFTDDATITFAGAAT